MLKDSCVGGGASGVPGRPGLGLGLKWTLTLTPCVSLSELLFPSGMLSVCRQSLSEVEGGL